MVVTLAVELVVVVVKVTVEADPAFGVRCQLPFRHFVISLVFNLRGFLVA